jgi:DNA-binding MarR family transcriptional regulator
MSEAKRLGSSRTRLLAQVATRSDRLVNEALAGAGARKWHFAVLATLDEFGPASQAELSERTRIHRSDLVAVINELTAQGQVERAPDAADRRRNVITLTAAGRSRLIRLAGILAAVEEELFAPLGPGDREEFARLLTLLAAHHARQW